MYWLPSRRWTGMRELERQGKAQTDDLQPLCVLSAYRQSFLIPQRRRTPDNVRPVLTEQVLTVVNPDARLIRLKSVSEAYRERLRHTSGDLSTVQPGYFAGLCGSLRATRQGTAAEHQGHNAKAHVLIDPSQLARFDGDAGLLKNLPPHRIARVLVQLDDPAGQDPFPIVGPLDGEHPAVLADDRPASADRMTGEIIGVAPTVAGGHFEPCAFRIVSR